MQVSGSSRAVIRMVDLFQAKAFGLIWQSDLPTSRFSPLASPVADVDVQITRVPALRPRASGIQINRGWIYQDGIRFAWGDEVAFDMRDGNRIDYAPGAMWNGTFPDAFYSSVVALLLVWRGLLPFHASTVSVDGRTVLIAGPAGSGKSTLAAALAGLGAHWLADDLSAVSRDAAGRFYAHPGRTVARLHAQVCDWIDARDVELIATHPRQKYLVRLTDVADAVPRELAGIMVLGSGPVAGATRLELLTRLLFRPRWLSQLPNAQQHRRQLLAAAEKVPVIGIPAAEMRDVAAFRAQGEAVLATIRSALP